MVHNYYNNVLIKLKRKYNKSELFLTLLKKLSEAELELGKSLSYINELEYYKKRYFQNKN